MVQFFKDTFKELSIYKSLTNAVDKKISPLLVSGFSMIHLAQMITAFSDRNEPVLVVAGSDSEAKRLCGDINAMAGSQICKVFPSKEWILTAVDGASFEYVHERISALSDFSNGKINIVICSAESLMQPVIPEKVLKDNTIILKAGESYDIPQLRKKLTEAGYQLSDTTEGISQFSSRGDLLDIFPVAQEKPFRIEFWGDEIDSISVLNTETQRREEKVDSISIPPAREVLYNPQELIEKIRKVSVSAKGKVAEMIRNTAASDIEHIENGIFPYADKYYDFVYDRKYSIADYGFKNVFWYDFNEISKFADGAETGYMEDCRQMLENGTLFKGIEEFFITFQKIQSDLSKSNEIYCSSFVQGSSKIRYKQLLSAECFQSSSWSGEMRQLCEDLEGYMSQGYRVYLAAGSEKTLPIIKKDLENSNIKCRLLSETDKLEDSTVYLHDGSFSGGFEYPENKTALITQAKSLVSRKRKRKHKAGKEILSIADIQKGDLVVHAMYGVGRFIGIRSLELDGIVKDYITIEYSGKENLYVPVTQMDLVSKYIGTSDEGKVKLNKLSSTEWQKARNSTRKAVKDMAKELTKLYAEREKTKGFAFYPDDEMQIEFEKRFPYIETDDQLTSIEEIKADMESEKPMDRLLCGDVGFGKTEVALRAAMKCIMSGKQCAILAPTTVLAWQHYQTAVRRFEPFSIKVELLSRYRTAKQQREIISELKKGSIDLIIGTHRIIQKDVVFHDLGLAVIDEEQRFGVAHKEKFKTLFKGIDVLTLSATPIPRTLNMAMSGLRDMSVLAEAPQDRHPVQTYILEYSEPVIMQAISRELKRDGQVYFIHNRVETIDLTAGKLQKLFPDANIAVAHGQMDEKQMSDVWQKVVEHEIDILVCTTIIETGIDVPNVNTLIIENADCFGLSQLYQLRGRVGRSSRRAYAYFTYQRNKVVSDVATKRLKAMREFTQFGSGFHIAMRDLEIRGAGSILGGQQHGHMEQVGYEMYMKMLEEAIAEEKGEPIQKSSECLIDLQIDAHIPENYIESLPQRLDIYRKIAAVSTEEDSSELIDELIDRFGEPPKSVQGLIIISQMRNRAASVGIEEINQKDDKIIVYTKNIKPQQISALSVKYRGRIMFNTKARHYIGVTLEKKQQPADFIKELVETMECI